MDVQSEVAAPAADTIPASPTAGPRAWPRMWGKWARTTTAFMSLGLASMCVVLAIEFPVKKHKFQSLSCVPASELKALETALAQTAFPAVWGYACDGAAKCTGVR